jgi:tetratricopeptide (TPR) repeat protein
MVHFVPPTPVMDPATPLAGFQITDVGEKFLLSLRNWTHNAFVHGHWDTQSTQALKRGRQASRTFSSSLNSGITLYQNGKTDLAWKQWNRALASFSNPELFKSWYYEIPLALLFEVSRISISGHAPLGEMLLRHVKLWAEKYLDPTDSRHALFTLFGKLDISQLRELYTKAARSMIDGLDTRLEKGHKLLYDVRLNRALDMLWYDAGADLSEFLPPIEEVDEALGPNNGTSIYFLLMEAYRLVAQDRHDEAELICAQVQQRLNTMSNIEGSVDWWRVGLGYRRLGRQQHDKGRFVEARRSFNTALRYVGGDSSLSRSVLIEICQRQQSMARAMNDQGDVYLWTQMLEGLEQATSKDKVVEIQEEPEEMTESEQKRVRITPADRTESPGPTRRGTTQW